MVVAPGEENPLCSFWLRGVAARRRQGEASDRLLASHVKGSQWAVMAAPG